MKLISKEQTMNKAEDFFSEKYLDPFDDHWETAASECDFEKIMEDTNIIIDTEDDDFTIFVMSAIRYAIGRRTYVPLSVTDYLKPLIPHVTNKLLFLLERDIREQGSYGEEAYGDPKIDKPVWMGFYELVKNEIERRKDEKSWSYD